MSALTFQKDKRWGFCANGCSTSGDGSNRGPRMGQTVAFLLGRPINGDREGSYFCPACVKEMRQVWDGALRERDEADQDWTRTVDEVAA